MAKVNEFGTNISVSQLASGDVVYVHRLQANRDTISGIIVRFSNHSVKATFLEKKASTDPIKIQVLPFRKFYQEKPAFACSGKGLGSEQWLPICLHRNNKILVIQGDGDKAFIVRNEWDLDSLA